MHINDAVDSVGITQYFNTNTSFLHLFHRVVPVNDNKEAVTVPITDLREGEMVKHTGETLKNACLNEDQLKVKFIITIYSYN